MTSMAASAAVVVYTEKSDFDVAVSGSTVSQTWPFTSATGAVSQLGTGSDIKIESFGADMQVEQLGSNGLFLKSIAWGGSDTIVANWYQVWTVADGTYALEFYYRGAGEASSDPDSVRVTIDYGSSNAPVELKTLRNVRFGYVGFVSDTPFTQVLFNGGGGNGEDPYWVNGATTYGGLGQPEPDPNTVVPLPAGLPLLAGGLLAFGLLGRRRKG